MSYNPDFVDLLDGVFGPNSDEFDTIKEAYDLITKTAATTSGEMKTHMLLLDHCRTKLSTLYYLLCRQISRKKATYQVDYDSAYTRLVKVGRPSNAAIESEIRKNNPQYASLCIEIEGY